MTEIAVAPFVMRNCVMQIEDDDFAAACSAIAFNPSGGSVVTFQGLKPESTHTFPGLPATWTLALTYAQDIETAASLSNYLHANEGQTKSVVFQPVDGGASVTASIVITPGALGGQGGAVASSTVNLGVNGKPAIVPAPTEG